MKKLIFKIIIFCLPLLFAVVIFRTYIIFKKQQPEQYQFDASIENLLLGHSQPECALNDSIIEKSVNRCQGGEAYFYTYTKLKKLLEVNNQIKTVYLSFSNNQIGKEMDKWTYGDIYILDKYPAYFYEMSKNDKFVLIKENFKSVISQSERYNGYQTAYPAGAAICELVHGHKGDQGLMQLLMADTMEYKNLVKTICLITKLSEQELEMKWSETLKKYHPNKF